MKTFNTYYEDYIGLQQFVANLGDTLSASNQTILVQIFCGICDRNYLSDIARQINELLPHAQVVGSTTGGEVMNGLVSGLKTVLAFSVFCQSDVRTAIAKKEYGNDYELGRSIAARLNSDRARVLVLFATGPAINASQLLDGVQSVNLGLAVAGGIAGDNFAGTQGMVLCNQEITDYGVVGFVIESEQLTVSCHSYLGWQPIGKEMTITRAEGQRVYTIDNVPAYQIYRQYLGIDASDSILKVLEFPLAICRNGLAITRTPFFRYEDDSLGFLSDMIEGETVRFSFGHVDMITEKIGTLFETIKQQPVESIFVYSCVSRRGFLQEAVEMETLPLQKIAPTSGFFTNGEFFHIDNSNLLLNTTITALALAETDDSQIPLPLQANEGIDTGDSYSLTSTVKDNATKRSIGVLRGLTYLVNKVTSELNETAAELELANEQLQYTSSHDALTGLYNRSFFEQEILRIKSAPVGVIMCDVDGLKLINDTCGHSHGDMLLKATADILKAVFVNDIVARIGGDEFSILIANGTQADIEDACQRIHTTVTGYNHINPAVPLSVSIGFSCRKDRLVDINTLLKEADYQMYREKLFHNQSTHSDLIENLRRALEERDIDTEEHSRRLQDLMISLALDSGYSLNKLADLKLLARFHDIGKIGISDQVLLKAGPLNADEKKEMQRHSEIGYRIAKSSVDLIPVADWILKHHEWWNGLGYPLGLKGESIPMECRILSIVDAYDAMTNDRPYRRAVSHMDALQEIKRCAGTQFDPVLVDRFIAGFSK